MLQEYQTGWGWWWLWRWGGVGSLSFDVQEQGGGGGLAQFGPIQTDRKRGRGKGTKIGHFFMDVINVWSLTETKLKFFT